VKTLVCRFLLAENESGPPNLQGNSLTGFEDLFQRLPLAELSRRFLLVFASLEKGRF
jgi:hypothetical protein